MANNRGGTNSGSFLGGMGMGADPQGHPMAQHPNPTMDGINPPMRKFLVGLSNLWEKLNRPLPPQFTGA